MQEDLVYDVGMNNGDDSAYYLSKGYRVVAIEDDPSLVAAGRSRFSEENRERQDSYCGQCHQRSSRK